MGKEKKGRYRQTDRQTEEPRKKIIDTQSETEKARKTYRELETKTQTDRYQEFLTTCCVFRPEQHRIFG